MRVRYRPTPIAISEPPRLQRAGHAGGAAKASKKRTSRKSQLWSSDEMEHSEKQKGVSGKSGASMSPSRKVDQKNAASIDYGSAFIMADLTGTVAHKARLQMLDVLELAHERTPGGLFYADRRPSRVESHISVIEIPVKDSPKQARQKESADDRATSAFQTIQRRHQSVTLELDDNALELFEGPRGPVKEFTVVSVALRDPGNNLSSLRKTFQEAGGPLNDKTAPMHLTLAYLKLGTKLDDATQKSLLKIARQANAEAKRRGSERSSGWQQKEFYYSGRYSDKEFLRLHLSESKP